MNIRDVIDNYVSIIASVPGVLRIYLFGSQVNGLASEMSDIDLMVIVEKNLNPIKMSLAVNKALVGKRRIPLAVLVNTETDFESAAKGPAIQRGIMEEGMIVYGE